MDRIFLCTETQQFSRGTVVTRLVRRETPLSSSRLVYYVMRRLQTACAMFTKLQKWDVEVSCVFVNMLWLTVVIFLTGGRELGQFM
jgi:hypothetical protein